MSTESNRSFASLLDELLVDSQIEEQSPAAPTVRFDYLAVADELLSGRIKVSSDTATSGYRDTEAVVEERVDAFFAAAQEKESDEAAADDVSQQLFSVEPEAIAQELGIEAKMPLARLAQIRRAFAFRNHPDRVAPHLRSRAIVRMQVANMLIDDARRRAMASA